ncbi:MAG: aldo/keto reductase [Planctomycetota bacterium]
MALLKRALGKTGLLATQLGFGAMELRSPQVWNGRAITDAEADSILNAVLDSGINFIDVAGCYGVAEESIGRFISSRRKEFYLATKCGCTMTPVSRDKCDVTHIHDRDTYLRNIDESLQRMKTDSVDIWQLHNPLMTPDAVRPLLETLETVKKSGRVKHIGISTTIPYIDDFIAMGCFDTFQIPYSCLQPEHHDAITRAAASGAGIIIRGGIGRGGPGAQTASKTTVDLYAAAKLDEVLPAGMTASDMILRYTLSHPDCHTTIIGTLNPAHLKQNIAAAEQGGLEKGLYDEITLRVRTAIQRQADVMKG